MRNLTFLSLVGLAIVFALAVAPKSFAKPSDPTNPCAKALYFSCFSPFPYLTLFAATYRATVVDDDDYALVQPDDDDAACNANNIAFHAKWIDEADGPPTPNPCGQCEVKVPLSSVVPNTDDDDCVFNAAIDDDDFDTIYCETECYESPYCWGFTGIFGETKGQINPAKGPGVNNGVEKEEASAFCGFFELGVD